uniref:Prefoldin subunit 6 n=1 Tax=Leersia perrieri TaxID=77586 RepID=A0A0D9VE85_9ORYZ
MASSSTSPAIREMQRDLEVSDSIRFLGACVQELELVNDEANVYKLIGPVLVKQDLAEAKANVKKRIEYISAELKRMDRALKDLEEKQNGKKESIFKLQQKMQAVQAKA